MLLTESGDTGDIYLSVPGQGNILSDGTWWTNCDVKKGEISIIECYQKKIVNNQYYRSSKYTECVETAKFDGRSFARWKIFGFSAKYEPCNCSLSNPHCHEKIERIISAQNL